MAYRVFISSTSKDSDLAKDLAQRLKESGIEVYSVNKTAAAREISFSKVNPDLGRADEVFLIFTENSLESHSLMFEMGAASSLRKRVTPIIVGLKPKDLPSLIKQMNYIKYPDVGRYIADLEKRAKAA